LITVPRVQMAEGLKERAAQFMNVYGVNIEEESKAIARQFQSVINGFYRNGNESGYLNRTADIKIAPEGTRVVLMRFAQSVHLRMQIGIFEVEALSKYANLEPWDAFHILVTHEYMHLLLGHLEAENAEAMHSMLVSDKPYQVVERIYSCERRLSHGFKHFSAFHPGLFQCLDPHPPLKADPIMCNIAFDLTINCIINMPEPALRASALGLPEGLHEWQYYAIVYALLSSYPTGEVHGKSGFVSSGQKSALSVHYGYARKQILQLYRCMQDLKSDEQILQAEGDASNLTGKNDGGVTVIAAGDVVPTGTGMYPGQERVERELKGYRYGNLQGNLPAFALKMQVAVGGPWKEFACILKGVERKTQRMKLSFVDAVDDWHRWNPRKGDSGLLLPGKRNVNGINERKMHKNFIIFVDTSSSMEVVLEPLFAFCYLALATSNCEVVFYDTQIVMECDRSKLLQLEPFVAGGTNVKNAILEWEAKHHATLKDGMVLTDGMDHTLQWVQQHRGIRDIWILTGNSIRKMEGI